MKQFTITSWKVNPVNLTCLAMLSVLLVITLTASTPQITPHHCIDPTHEQCDGNCECDGLACELDIVNSNKLRDYQLEITNNQNGTYNVIMFDGDRIVGVLPLDNHCNLTKLIERDNQ